MDWFRWHHGSVTDPKFSLIAKKAGSTVAEVIGVWACLLENASAAEVRGNHGPVDWESMAHHLGIDEDRLQAIYGQFDTRGLVKDGSITAWEKRQPKRERDDNSTGRVQAFRGRKRHETPSNATDGQETPRGEESRGEENSLSTYGTCPPPANDAPAKAQKYEVPDCPHADIVGLYHANCPTLPKVEVMNDSRKGMLRQRWREVCAEEKYDIAHGLDWWRDFFAFVATSKFLTGRARPKAGEPPFLADFEWLIGPKNFAKVIERRYHREAT